MKNLILIPKEIIPDKNTISIAEDCIDKRFFKRMGSKLHFVKASGGQMCVKGYNDFIGKAIYLTPDFDYILGKDSYEGTILVPIIKGSMEI